MPRTVVLNIHLPSLGRETSAEHHCYSCSSLTEKLRTTVFLCFCGTLVHFPAPKQAKHICSTKNFVQLNSTNVIYLDHCKKCNLEYVGSITTEFRIRFRNHKSFMKTNKRRFREFNLCKQRLMLTNKTFV